MLLLDSSLFGYQKQHKTQQMRRISTMPPIMIPAIAMPLRPSSSEATGSTRLIPTPSYALDEVKSVISLFVGLKVV